MEPEIDQAARKERDRERRLRGRAKSLGLWMRKGRARHLSLDNQGRYADRLIQEHLLGRESIWVEPKLIAR
jgi:hypothetical protein